MVTGKIIMVGGLADKAGRPAQQKIPCLRSASEFVQAKSAVDVSGRTLRKQPPQLIAHVQSLRPHAAAHKNDQPELEDLLAPLIFSAERIQLAESLGRHFQLNVALRGKQGAFE